MRIRKKPWAEPELAVCPFFVKDPESYRGEWKSHFKKEQPIYLEVGCGKGGFVGQTALNKPEINFIAVDIKSDMLGVARRNIVKLFEAEEKQQFINDAIKKSNCKFDVEVDMNKQIITLVTCDKTGEKRIIVNAVKNN